MNIVYCYSPTNKADDLIKKKFYLQLQSVIDETFSARDVNILVGDLNTKEGSVNTGFEESMGYHGLDHINEKCELFENLCVSNNLVIGGTFFPHNLK